MREDIVIARYVADCIPAFRIVADRAKLAVFTAGYNAEAGDTATEADMCAYLLSLRQSVVCLLCERYSAEGNSGRAPNQFVI